MAELSQDSCPPPTSLWKSWLYTNFDCNLRCSYCVAKSSPNAPRRALGMANVTRLVDEAVELGFSEIFFTGGEPFILKDIYEMLDYASARVRTTVLTNAMMPSVLIELGFISNAREEELLTDPSFHEDAAKAIARAVQDFFRRYPPGASPPTGPR